ncbi:TA system antitoxin ParD family protein [Hoeflea olei]|uniref:ParD-like antitoxin of type II toxin-antitoxin system n=1 Tax=Hoeflea olei TaxID=1480615 RepID=A0A1C1YQC2_9HYPH|nr:hypothetical protein [Hoeflea olei]OCW55699.1 hypothetical protein AWJ14_14520 [Hoeflea olei]
MAQSVKLGDDIMALVRREAELHSRSTAGQITHWLKIGRAIEHSGRFDHARITAALEGKLDTTQLGEEEEAAWLDGFVERMAQPSDSENAFHARRQALGRGVGLDAGGNLVHAKEGDAP